MPKRPPSALQGFTLIELTIVLVIITLLSGGLLLGLSRQQDQTLIKETQVEMEQAKDALLGFAMRYGRLPCPAAPNQSSDIGGSEALEACSPAPHRPATCQTGDNQCALKSGVLPWRTLGIKETDAWGQRLTYQASFDFTDPLTSLESAQGERNRVRIDIDGNLDIEDGAAHKVAISLPAVIISHGKRAFGAYASNGSQIPGASGDEAENADNGANSIFISHNPNDNYDDIVSWVVPSVLKSRLVAVGRLP